MVVGEDVDDDGIGAGIGSGGGAVGACAGAGQVGAAGAEHAEGGGAAFTRAAGVVGADGGGELVDASRHEFGVGGGQPAPYGGGAGGVVAVPELDVTAFGGGVEAPDGGGVVDQDGGIDGVLEFGHRHRAEGRGDGGEVGVDAGQDVGIVDQLGAPADGVGQRGGQGALGDQFGDLGQPVTQRQSLAHLRGGRAWTDPTGRGDLGGRTVPTVTGPQLPLDGLFGGAASVGEFGDGGHPVKGHGGRGAGPAGQGIDQRRIIDMRQVIALG